MTRVIVLLALAMAAPVHANAQSAAPQRSPPFVTVIAGLGNAMGWMGVQGERYVHNDRLSLFAGVGYLPEVDNDASGVAVAGGLRAFTSGVTHRMFLEGSISQLAVETSCFDSCSRYYGPGAQVGYQFVMRRGLTIMGSIGVGYAPGLPAGDGAAALAGIGMGFTWRQQRQ